MDISKKTALKILALYALTSCVFLTLVFYGWYATKRDSIIKAHISALNDSAHTLLMQIYEQSQNAQNLNTLLEDSEIPFVLITDNGTIILNTLEHIRDSAQIQEILNAPELLSHTRRNRIIKATQLNGRIYLITQFPSKRFLHLFHQHTPNPSFHSMFIIIESQGFRSEIYTLLSTILVSFIFALLAISVIAYFLVSLSLKPLREKITHLNNFIKDSTHEINTPISVILMSIERIKPSALNQSQAQKFERIKLAAKTLEQIYQDLLFYTFDEAKDSTRETISLKNLIQERLEYFKPFFNKKNIAITLIEDSNTESLLNANTSKIVRVVDNLLDNALKYTQNGGNVTITLSARSLSIQDNGCGIAKEHLDKIFTRYYRANSNQGGFGIGLALAKQICTLYGISLTCHSILGKGSTFTLKW